MSGTVSGREGDGVEEAPATPAALAAAGAWLPPPAPREAGDDSDGADGRSVPMALWHVTVTFAGPAVDAVELQASLARLIEQHPFLASVRWAPDRAEVRYWDEAEDVDDAAALGLRLWSEHRRSADLPGWRCVGLEVVDRDTLHARGQPLPAPSAAGDLRPL